LKRVDSAWFQRFKVRRDELLSSFGFNCNLRHYSKGGGVVFIRGKLTTDMETMGHVLAVEARGALQTGGGRGGGGSEGGSDTGGVGGGGSSSTGGLTLFHHRLQTDFTRHLTLRSRMSRPILGGGCSATITATYTTGLNPGTSRGVTDSAQLGLELSSRGGGGGRGRGGGGGGGNSGDNSSVNSGSGGGNSSGEDEGGDGGKQQHDNTDNAAKFAATERAPTDWRWDAKLSNDFLRRGKQRAWIKYSASTSSCSSWAVSCGGDVNDGAGVGVEWRREWGSGGGGSGGGGGDGGGGSGGGGGSSGGSSSFSSLAWPHLPGDDSNHGIEADGAGGFVNVRVALLSGGGGGGGGSSGGGGGSGTGRDVRAFVEFAL